MSENQSAIENKPSGCGFRILQGFISVWIIGASIVTQIVTWFMEQAIFEGSIAGTDSRWVVVLVYGFSQFIPALVFNLIVKDSSLKALMRAWLAASVFVILTAPLRLLSITDSLTLRLGQIAVILFLLLLIRLVGSYSSSNPLVIENSGKSDKGLVALIIAATSVPWILYGALGSLLDTVMGLMVGILFGILFCRLLLLIAFPVSSSGNPSNRGFMPGWVFVLLSLILSTGLGQNGNQWLISLTIPAFAGLFWFFARLKESSIPGYNLLDSTLLVATAVSWPLIWFDADELMYVIASAEGEVLSWALRSVLFSVTLALFFTFVLVILNKKQLLSEKKIKFTGFLAVIVWVILGYLYLFVGQPGFYGERLFVIFNDQKDVSAASSMDNYLERRQYVYNQLVNQAELSQRRIQGLLDRFNIQYHRYYLVNAMEVDGGPLLGIWLESQPEVDRVLASPALRPLPAEIPLSSGTETSPGEILWNLQLIGADTVWEKGFRGKGIVIGQSDSGVQGDHPELSGSYRGRSGDNAYNWYDPWFASQSPVDIGGHGTHTLGTILGKNVGIAPQAEWIGCVNLARNLGNPALYLDCMQFMLAPFPQDGDPFTEGRPELGAHVMNNSWGCPEIEGCDPGALSSAVNALRAAGLFVVASAGNSGNGDCGTVTDPPALYDSAYSVGAVDRQGELAPFSSIGPVMIDGSYNIKPDILAPGVDVLSAYPNSTYQFASGTSMAGPHVAGVVALIWSANPDLIGNIEKTEEILNSSASEYTGWFPACANGDSYPNNAAGYGVLNAYEAVTQAINLETGQTKWYENSK